jgi:hypothetical protein
MGLENLATGGLAEWPQYFSLGLPSKWETQSSTTTKLDN